MQPLTESTLTCALGRMHRMGRERIGAPFALVVRVHAPGAAGDGQS